MKITCEICGHEFREEGNLFCPVCGNEIKQETIDNALNSHLQNKLMDTIINVDDKLANFASDKINGNKYFDKVMDFASAKTKDLSHGVMDSSANKKLFEHLEPEFLEVFDSIEDPDVQTLFWFERMKLTGGGGITFSIAGIFVPTLIGLGLGAGGNLITPTIGLTSQEKLDFYKKLLANLNNELKIEKQKDDFDMDKIFEKKMREAVLGAHPLSFIPKALKARRKIRKF